MVFTRHKSIPKPFVQAGKLIFPHGMYKTKIYQKWRDMKRRCNAHNPSTKMYKNYTSRGITVCDEWQNSFMSFYNWAIANGYSEGLELDRKDNDQGYTPSNCRFVTHAYNQMHKRGAKYVTINGITKTGTEWAIEYGLSPHLVNERIKSGWSTDRLFIPSQGRGWGKYHGSKNT